MQIYLVGGAVRDRLLGLKVKDHDWVVVGATPEEMIDAGYKPVGKDFPVFLHPKTAEEYALARTERKSGKGYTGFEFFASPDVSLEEDLRRRDLTINAIAQDSDGQLIDPYGGQQDIEARVLRHVSPAFREDPLRVLRVARFAARFADLNFRIADETLALMREISASDELDYLTPERVWQEFERALGTRSPLVFIHSLNAVSACERLLPEFCELDSEAAETASTQLAENSGNAEQQFALLTNLATASAESDAALEQIRELSVRLRAPNRFRDLALQLRQFHQDLATFSELAAERKLKLVKQLDLLRRPERLELLRPCAAALVQTETGGIAEGIETLLERMSAVEPRQLMSEGFSGKALGEEIEKRQLAICAEG
ncbi:hypothetical protein [Marinobacterium mangrovicola]|uniref:CCA-adding enzyme n=1 Tax=Marinobacterium mangrovicola TaxID=1476959 RepID=A0A4R1GRJ3_9GAMM|nr:hypothetical protein [Marinobacterium mangrovicola]TCK07142.1 tRNA nucleotidyltransferase (CCA-adding enzyme) [Marinobacterium mangrovicola]